jgi:cytochrome P450
MTMFFLLMVLNPEAQAKAQAEMDKVTGGERLPTFKDRSALPYTEAIMSESLRWGPISKSLRRFGALINLLPHLLSALG